MHIIAFHGTGVWARIDQVFAFDAVSYFLQAFAGEVLLIFPIVYGFTNSAPFNTWNIEFALYFFPFIITGILPTVAALGWQKTPSAKVSEASAGSPCPCHFVLEKQEVRCPRDMMVFFLSVQGGLAMVPRRSSPARTRPLSSPWSRIASRSGYT